MNRLKCMEFWKSVQFLSQRYISLNMQRFPFDKLKLQKVERLKMVSLVISNVRVRYTVQYLNIVLFPATESPAAVTTNGKRGELKQGRVELNRFSPCFRRRKKERCFYTFIPPSLSSRHKSAPDTSRNIFYETTLLTNR